MKNYTIFWGCTIPARFPYIEKSVRVSMDKLGMKFKDINGFTCCPERSLVKSMDEEVWLLSAARNIAVAEKEGCNIMTPCTGCHSVLRTVRAQLLGNAPLRTKVNRKLAKVGLEFTGKTDIYHLVEFLYEELGPALITKKVVRPLWGTKIALHFGCHLVRPTNAVRWDDPFKPSKFGELITTLGAKLVNYDLQDLCCGSYLGRVGNQDGNLNFAKTKLENIKTYAADAMTVACPSCFQQFDLNQSVLMRKKLDLGIPVLYLTELMALALGVPEEELGLTMHRVDVSSFINKQTEMAKLRQELLKNFPLTDLERCYACKACQKSCSSARVNETFDPTKVIGMVLDGKIDELLAGEDIWKCVECDLCHELCSQRHSMGETFRTLKHMAIAAGQAPKQVNSGVDMYMSSGMLGEPRLSEREKLGLPDLPKNGTKQWKGLIKGLGDE